MFERFSDSATGVIRAAREAGLRLKAPEVGCEHILLALAEDPSNFAALALLGMGADPQTLEQEIERLAGAGEMPPPVLSRDFTIPGEMTETPLSEFAREALRLSLDYCRYFGQAQVEPEHLLFGVLDIKEGGAVKVLEELGANMTFLKRQVTYSLAQRWCHSPESAPSLSVALVRGLKDLIETSSEAAASLSSLAARSGWRSHGLPGRAEIVHMVCLAYLADFLATQVAFQRYLLEESLKLLGERTGSLDRELRASIVSNAAQNLRSEVRATIEHLWTHEYHLFDQTLDEAEHDLIGSVLEDLWWAHSEEIALHELFGEALDDHRRKQLLSLQKRRIEIFQRLFKLRGRLAETVRQCFARRRISA